MKRAVLFDLDDTLHDRTASIRMFVAAQAQRLLAMQAPDAMQFAERFLQLEQRGKVWKDKVYQDLGREFPQARRADERLLQDYLHSFPKSCKLQRGAAELLQSLRNNGFKLGIVTNGRTVMQLAVVAALNLEALVDVVVVSEQVGLRKPDRRIFCHALAQIGIDPQSSAFVGDDFEADVMGALSAGFRHAYWLDVVAVAPIDVPVGISRVGDFTELAEMLLSFEASKPDGATN